MHSPGSERKHDAITKKFSHGTRRRRKSVNCLGLHLLYYSSNLKPTFFVRHTTSCSLPILKPFTVSSCELTCRTFPQPCTLSPLTPPASPCCRGASPSVSSGATRASFSHDAAALLHERRYVPSSSGGSSAPAVPRLRTWRWLKAL